jgi:hypothetical protein
MAESVFSIISIESNLNAKFVPFTLESSTEPVLKIPLLEAGGEEMSKNV